MLVVIAPCGYLWHSISTFYDYPNLNLYVAVLNTLLFLLQLATGLVLVRTLKNSFKAFYEKARKDISLSLGLLLGTYAIRAVEHMVVSVRHFNIHAHFEGSLDENGMFAPFYFVIHISIGIFIPILAKLVSLAVTLREKQRLLRKIKSLRDDMGEPLDGGVESDSEASLRNATYVWSDHTYTKKYLHHYFGVSHVFAEDSSIGTGMHKK